MLPLILWSTEFISDITFPFSGCLVRGFLWYKPCIAYLNSNLEYETGKPTLKF